MPLHRYLLFSGPSDAHAGGWGDFTDSLAELADAIAAGKRAIGAGATWWHVVDGTTGELMADQFGEE